MGKMTRGMNMIVGLIRSIFAAFFATILLLVLFPTITALAGVLSYGIWMFFRTDFYALLLIIMAIFSIANIAAKMAIPDVPSGE